MGALSLQNGVWLLPHCSEKETFLQELLVYIRQQDAGGYIFKVNTLTKEIEDDICTKFKIEREEEYKEFIEKCGILQEELTLDIKEKKFTFAELEDTEQDHARLETWFAKIQERDFNPGEMAQKALAHLEENRRMIHDFSGKVYAFEDMRTEEQS